MILSDRFIQLVQSPAASLWVSNCNEQLVPELVRVLGAQVAADKEHITFYLPLRFGKEVVQNFASTTKLTFLLAIVLTNESYQLKGTYLSHRPSTPAEVRYQETYVRSFCVTLEGQGFTRDDTYRAYFHQPSVAVHMQVKEVYEQTPKVGTGEKVLSA